MSDYKLRLDPQTVEILKAAYPSSPMSTAIDLAVRDLAAATQRTTLEDYLAAHALAQADAAAQQANLLVGIADTLTAGLGAQQQAAAELTALATQILKVVEQIAQPAGQGEDRIAQVLEALSGIAKGIDQMGSAVGDLAEQILALGS